MALANIIRQNAMTLAEMSGRNRTIIEEELTDKRAIASQIILTPFKFLHLESVYKNKFTNISKTEFLN